MASAARHYERRDGISLARLHLDPENPRHDPLEDEDKIIGHLMRTEKVQVLAKSIVENGGISPLDAIGVVDRERRFQPGCNFCRSQLMRCFRVTHAGDGDVRKTHARSLQAKRPLSLRQLPRRPSA